MGQRPLSARSGHSRIYFMYLMQIGNPITTKSQYPAGHQWIAASGPAKTNSSKELLVPMSASGRKPALAPVPAPFRRALIKALDIVR